jgi:hypothetical protein
MTKRDKALLRRLSGINLDIVEVRRDIEGLRDEILDAGRSRLLTRLENILHEMILHRSTIIDQLNARSRGRILPE